MMPIYIWCKKEEQVAIEVLIKAIAFPKEMQLLVSEVGFVKPSSNNINGYILRHVIAAIQHISNDRYSQGYFYGTIRDEDNIKGYLNKFGHMADWHLIAGNFKAVKKSTPEVEWRT